ncbi:hypothetical protein AB733_12500 [Photobacterium swingsii]|uniref:LicD family protein n=1 Tax=Photobacterium swingsii TaxID=680026 RepID=A0A0J8XXT8_9GAMM|nr:hypothetical protein [Photobacterium swingsii]KMV30234.1 hypothetical protein AB733_12500 [Photobacterium swingsii]PSW23303.1 hypothetical protein C9I94_16930 [Photobacterium swingsii]
MSLNIFINRFPYVSKTKVLLIYRRFFLSIYKNKLMVILTELNKILDNKLILEYGTMLGAVRCNSVLPHDYDLDFGFPLSDWSLKIREEFFLKGFTLRHEFIVDGVVFEESYGYKGIVVDIFYYEIEDQKIYTPVFRRVNDRWTLFQFSNRFNGFKSIPFEDTNMSIPVNFDSHLKSYYGADYIIPNAQWSGPNDAVSTQRLASYVKK